MPVGTPDRERAGSPFREREQRLVRLWPQLAVLSPLRGGTANQLGKKLPGGSTGWRLCLARGPSLFEHLAASDSHLAAPRAYSYLTDRPWSTSRKKPGPEANLMSLKIMVVDDEPLSLQLIRSLAAPAGHTVLTFEDSQEAGERAETQRFDVTFVGIPMPQLDGLELARRIRNSRPNRETTIVMLSAADDIGNLRKAFGEGADFVLT